jgi:hypothetical protein
MEKEVSPSVELLPNLCYNYIVVEKRKRKAFGCVVRKIPICETLDYYLATCYNYIIVKMKGEHYTMNKLSSVVAAIKSKVFKMSGDKINQTERNAFKSEVLASLLSDLGSVGSVSRTADGIVLEVENDELGVVYLEFDVKIKDVSFDLNEAVTDYQTLVDARTERVTSAAKRKEQRIAEKAKVSKK